MVMSLDTSKLAEDMFSACKKVFSEKWPEIKVYADSETKKLAASLAMIEKLNTTAQTGLKNSCGLCR